MNGLRSARGVDRDDKDACAHPDRQWHTDMVEAVLCSGVFAATTSRELLVWLIGEALGQPVILAGLDVAPPGAATIP